MKYIKLFESNDQFQKGYYVKRNDIPDNIYIITKCIIDNDYNIYIIYNIDSSSTDGGCYVSSDEIELFAKDKEELNAKLAGNKYNL